MTVLGASLPAALGGIDDDVVRLRAARRLTPLLRRLRGPPVAVAGPSASPAIPRAYLSWRWVGFTAGRGRGRWLPNPPHGGSVRGGWSMVCVVVAGSFSSGMMLLAASACMSLPLSW
jgi:hypothetical protein